MSQRQNWGRAAARESAHAELHELEAYVMEMLAGAERERFEAHVGICARCAAALGAEADREMVLVRALAQIARPRPWFERAGSWFTSLSRYRLRAWRVRGGLALRYLEATTTALPMAALAALVLTLSTPQTDGGRPAGTMAPFSGFSGSFSAMEDRVREAAFPALACLALDEGAVCQAGAPDGPSERQTAAGWRPEEPGACWPDRGGRAGSCALQSRDP